MNRFAMKTKLLLTLVTALGTAAGVAQNGPPPNIPIPPEPGARPENPPPPPPRDGGPGSPEGRRPEGAPDQPPGDFRGPRDGQRGPEGGPRDGDRGPKPGPRDGDRGPEGGPRDGDRPRFPGRGDGERPRFEARDGFRSGERIERPQLKPTPYLGVVTATVPGVLSSQLGLAEGFGLVVQEVVPGSPAAEAGIQRYDVLKQLEDQQLTDPSQLATLVRARGKDASVSVTLLRKAQEQKVTVKIGERNLPERRPLQNPAELYQRNIERFRDASPEQREQMEQRMREMRERMEKFRERMQEWQKNPQGPAPEPPRFGGGEGVGGDFPPGPGPRDLLHESRPGGAPQVSISQDGATTTWNTAQARVMMKDDNGQVEISSENGARVLTAKDKDGKVTFTGPIDTPEQRQAIPEELRKKVERMQLRHRAEASAGGVRANNGGPFPDGPRGPAPGGGAEIQ